MENINLEMELESLSSAHNLKLIAKLQDEIEELKIKILAMEKEQRKRHITFYDSHEKK